MRHEKYFVKYYDPTLPLLGEVGILKGIFNKRQPAPTFSSLQPEKNLRKSKFILLQRDNWYPHFIHYNRDENS
jgi:hypothetical protein